MQVVTWLPRTELPFAAPSRPELLVLPEPPAAPVMTPAANVAVAPSKPVERPKIEVPRPSVAPRATNTPVAEAEKPPVVAKVVPLPAPRFALQLLRAGRCLVLVELPTGGAITGAAGGSGSTSSSGREGAANGNSVRGNHVTTCMAVK